MKHVLKLIYQIGFTITVMFLDVIPHLMFGSRNGRITNAKMDFRGVWSSNK